jgi:ribonuclease VapC
VTALVVDTSAACAVLFGEDGRLTLLSALVTADDRLMSSATSVELAMVVEARLGPSASTIAGRFIEDAAIDVVPFTAVHVARALEGWRRYGKGRHPAGLNMGDLFAYALAVDEGCPVLCVGDDFARTDVAVIRP